MTDHTSGRWDQPLPILELLKSGRNNRGALPRKPNRPQTQ